ncbi:hypothetical protein GGI23_006247 [Coemansia sp. RSA 2559]|nr:hypothetical protein GGI23_006247 [Coemansia sp. RSA 2559]
MAATLSPRLRVDNGIRIWHYSGSLVYNKEISELYQVDWRPAPATLFPQRSALSPVPVGIAIATPASTEKDAKPAGAYRPPHARSRNSDNNSPRSLYDMAEQKSFGGAATQRSVPGANPEAASAKKSEKKQRRRDRKKSSKDDADNKAGEHDAPAPNAHAAADKSESPLSDIDVLKKIRQLNKKLDQIETLTKKRDQGEPLEDNQIVKIGLRPQIESEIAALTARLSNPPS